MEWDDRLGGLTGQLRHFAHERDWEQFHTPKNLAMALVAEAGELAEVFQWLTPEQSQDMSAPGRLARLEDEVADVLIYLVRLADVCGIDLVQAAHDKIDRNERRYPVELSRGSAEKYTALEKRNEVDAGLEDA